MVRPIRVLSIADDPSLRETAVALEHEDDRFTVETATSAAAGLDALDAGSFDGVVVASNLPDNDWLSVFEAVRERQPTLRFLLITGPDDDAAVQEALAAGVTDVVRSRPGAVDTAVLANRLRNSVPAADRTEAYRERIQAVITDTGAAVDDRIERLLDLGRDLLDAENGHVVEIDRGRGRHEVRFAAGSELVMAGTVSELSETFCRRTVDADGTLDIPDADDDPAADEWDIGRYVGAKLFVGDELFGTLCFVDREPNDSSLTAAQKASLDLISRWISHALESKAAEKRRNEIFDRMADGLFALDKDWQFTYVNDRGAEILSEAIGTELAAAEIVGLDIWEAIPEAVDTPFYDNYHAAMTEQEPASFEAYYDPIGRWFNVRVFPSETGISVYFLDITEQRRREEAIKDREAVLQEVHEVVSDVDRSFEEQVGALLDIGRRVIGTEYGSLSRVRGDEYVFEVVRAPEGTIEAGDTVDLSATHCERAIVTKESLVLADVAADAPDLTDRAGYTELGIKCYIGTPVRVDGQVYGTFCFYGDEPRQEPFSEWQVTLVDLLGRWISYGLERQEVEEQLRRQNDRLEEFASRLSHDLRNPLNVATLHLDMLERELDTEAPDHITQIRGAHDRMETLVSDILTMAREGRAVEETETVSLEEAATVAWGHTESGAAALDIADDCRFQADPDRLERVLENFFRNSLEHGTDDAGTLTVRVGPLRDGFYVEDDGRGIPSEDREQVFEYGYSTDEDGTGFGLGIVKEIIEAHGWEISLTESEAGGARFEVTGVDTTSA